MQPLTAGVPVDAIFIVRPSPDRPTVQPTGLNGITTLFVPVPPIFAGGISVVEDVPLRHDSWQSDVPQVAKAARSICTLDATAVVTTVSPVADAANGLNSGVTTVPLERSDAVSWGVSTIATELGVVVTENWVVGVTLTVACDDGVVVTEN